MSTINGTDVLLYIPTEDIDNDTSATAWEPAALAKESSLNIDIDTPNASNKDSSGWAESISGQRSWTITFSGLTDYTLTLASDRPNVRAFFAYILTRSTIKVAWGQDGYHWYGNAQITNLSLTAPMEDVVNNSISLKGTGSLTLTADGSTDIDAAATYPE